MLEHAPQTNSIEYTQVPFHKGTVVNLNAAMQARWI